MSMVSRRPFASAATCSLRRPTGRGLAAADLAGSVRGRTRGSATCGPPEKFAATAAWCRANRRARRRRTTASCAQLADANRRYEERFGHIFIVCATGKTAAEMLAILH